MITNHLRRLPDGLVFTFFICYFFALAAGYGWLLGVWHASTGTLDAADFSMLSVAAAVFASPVVLFFIRNSSLKRGGRI